MEKKFNISFDEFEILTSVTIPPRPIARSMFWHDVINKHYHTLSWSERGRLFEWVNRHHGMQSGVAEGNEDCLLFNARFNPLSQFKVYTNFGGENKIIEAFLWQNRYHTAINTSIQENYITKVEKLNEEGL